jgi:hypothetical protein
LIASVFIDRTMQISSATDPIFGNSEQISCPLRPYRANGNCGAKQASFCPCNCAIG